MVLKLKDIYKLATHIEDFLKKLDADSEFAIIRDTLNLSLLNLQRYYKSLASQLENISSTKFVIIDKYSWKWMDLPNKKFSAELPVLLQAIKTKNANDIKMQSVGNISNICDSIGRNALFYIVHYFNEKTFNSFIEAEIDVNKANHDGQNALHLACKEGNLIALKALLLRGADVYSSDEFGRTAMHWSIVAPDSSCLEYLLESGYAASKCSDHEGMTPTMWAAHLSRIDHLRLLLNRFPLNNDTKNKTSDDSDDDIERDQYGRMWIHWCVRSTSGQSCLKEYLNKEFLKIKDNLGRSVVHVAAEKGSVEAMETICSIGGSDIIEERDSLDRTPLIIAVMGGHGELINHLLDMNADILKVDRFGASAWDYARSNHLHYCMLIIASYLRRTTNQPSLDLSSSINFNQSLRLSLSYSRSSDLYRKDGSNDSEMRLSRNSMTHTELPQQQLQPHPPKTPNISPLRNFRRRNTPSPSEVRYNNEIQVSKSSKEILGHAENTQEASSDKLKGGGDFKKSPRRMKKTSKRRMSRQEVTTRMGSSSDEIGRDDEDGDDGEDHHHHSRLKTGRNPNRKWTKENVKMNFAAPLNSVKNDVELKEPANLHDLPTRDLTKCSAEYPSNSVPIKNPYVQEKLATDNKQIEKSLQTKKVNFKLSNKPTFNENSSSEGEDHKINVCNLVAKERFAKWDVSFSSHEKSEHADDEQNKNSGQIVGLSSASPSTNLSEVERTDIRSQHDRGILLRVPMPAPRRLPRMDDKTRESTKR